MAYEKEPQDHDLQGIIVHDCGHGDIGALEDTFFGDVAALKEAAPDPLAPIAEHIAHSLGWARVRSTAEKIAVIHEEHAQESEQRIA